MRHGFAQRQHCKRRHRRLKADFTLRRRRPQTRLNQGLFHHPENPSRNNSQPRRSSQKRVTDRWPYLMRRRGAAP